MWFAIPAARALVLSGSSFFAIACVCVPFPGIYKPELELWQIWFLFPRGGFMVIRQDRSGSSEFAGFASGLRQVFPELVSELPGKPQKLPGSPDLLQDEPKKFSSTPELEKDQRGSI